MRTVRWLAVAVSVFAVATVSAAVFEHAVWDSVSLDGEWEMAYQPYANESVEHPEFSGVRVAAAVPGYWEDMETGDQCGRFLLDKRTGVSFPVAEIGEKLFHCFCGGARVLGEGSEKRGVLPFSTSTYFLHLLHRVERGLHWGA